MKTSQPSPARAIIAAALALFASGCASYNTRMVTGLPTGGEVKERDAKFYVYGLVGDDNVDLAQVCPSGVAAVQTQMTAGDKLFTVLTLGIYSPMTMIVECAGGSAFLLEADEEKQVTWVQPYAG